MGVHESRARSRTTRSMLVREIPDYREGRAMGEYRPKLFKQGATPTCWAAALASWLDAVPGRTRRGPNFLLEYFSAYTRDDGFLPWRNIDSVTESIIIRMDYEVLGGANMDAGYVLDILKWCPIYLIAMPPGGGGDAIAHARVIWSVTDGGVRAVDPIKGYVNWSYEEMKHFYTIMVGWAKGRYSGAFSPSLV
jgi:hypothetical protein